MENKSGLQWFFDAYKQYATFTGRSRRKAYWYWSLFYIVTIFILLGLLSATESPIFLGLYMLFIFASLIPALAVGVRRMHDAGKSGWFLLIPIYSLILALTDSEPGTNKWGPNPKNPELNVADHLVE